MNDEKKQSLELIPKDILYSIYMDMKAAIFKARINVKVNPIPMVSIGPSASKNGSYSEKIHLRVMRYDVLHKDNSLDTVEFQLCMTFASSVDGRICTLLFNEKELDSFFGIYIETHQDVLDYIKRNNLCNDIMDMFKEMDLRCALDVRSNLSKELNDYASMTISLNGELAVFEVRSFNLGNVKFAITRDEIEREMNEETPAS